MSRGSQPDAAASTPGESTESGDTGASQSVRRLADWSASQLEAIADEYGTPTYVVDLDRVRENYRRFADAFPDARVMYAAKANTGRAVLEAVLDAGADIECAARGELERAVAAGADPNTLRYTAVNPPPADLDYATELAADNPGLTITAGARDTFDRLEERGYDGRVAIRVNPGIGTGHHEKVATGRDAKFGIPAEEVPAFAVGIADRFELVGLHAHVGSGVLHDDLDDHCRALATVADLAREVEDTLTDEEHTAAGEESAVASEEPTAAGEESAVASEEHTAAGETSTVASEEHTAAGETSTVASEEHTAAGEESAVASEEHTVAGEESAVSADDDIHSTAGPNGSGPSHDGPLSFIDFGGGFGVPYHPDEEPLDLSRVADRVREAIGDLDARIELEPGRYVVADAATILTRVNTVKETPETTVVGVDASLATLVRPAMFDAYHPIRNVSAPEREATPVSVGGPCCTSADVFCTDRPLAEPERGDLLAIGNAGAYGYELASRFHSQPLPAEVAVEGDSWRVSRERETLADVTRLERS